MADNGSVRKLMEFVVTEDARNKAKVTEAKATQMAIITLLGELGGMNVQDDAILFEGNKIVLPESYEGRIPDVVRYLREYHEAQEKHHEFSKKFMYRPWDGAHAFNATMKKMFGTVGIGKNRPATFFSPERPPQMITINVGVDKTDSVPWGEVFFPPLECTFHLRATRDREYGMLFELGVDAPKKFKRHIDAFFQMVAEELKTNSIFKGHAINGSPEPAFLDLSRIDRNKVVYSDDVMTQLDTNLWSLIKHTDLMRELGMPLKRAVLLEGPYGTGKSLAGALTAQEAITRGWTYILCRPGQDNLFDVLKTAQLYAPAVIWYEDIDTLANGGTSEEISTLLDALDGVQNKGSEILAGFTSNHVEKIQKGVLRPGRLDAIIHIGELDADGYKKLIHNLIKPELIGDIDYPLVTKAFAGFLPAFVTEAINNALRYSIARTNGKPSKIETEDLVNSALGLRRQLDLMNGAGEGENVPTMDSVFKSTVVDLLEHTETYVEDKESGNLGMKFNPNRQVAVDAE
jgi:transitional endoplasmic reticulum ATPase